MRRTGLLLLPLLAGALPAEAVPHRVVATATSFGIRESGQHSVHAVCAAAAVVDAMATVATCAVGTVETTVITPGPVSVATLSVGGVTPPVWVCATATAYFSDGSSATDGPVCQQTIP